jgi:hypothetical protein
MDIVRSRSNLDDNELKEVLNSDGVEGDEDFMWEVCSSSSSSYHYYSFGILLFGCV